MIHQIIFKFYLGVDIAENGEITTARVLKICVGQIQNLVIQALNTAIASKLLGSLDILRDSYTGMYIRKMDPLLLLIFLITDFPSSSRGGGTGKMHLDSIVFYIWLAV